MSEKTPDEKKPIARLLAIEWPEDEIAAYANHLLAVSDGTSVYLTFCQVRPPAVVGTGDERQKCLDQIKSVKAKSVTRLVVPLASLREMVRILQDHITRIDNLGHDDAAVFDS